MFRIRPKHTQYFRCVFTKLVSIVFTQLSTDREGEKEECQSTQIFEYPNGSSYNVKPSVHMTVGLYKGPSIYGIRKNFGFFYLLPPLVRIWD